MAEGKFSSGGMGMSWNFPFTKGGWASTPENSFPPSTTVWLHTTFFMASSGFTQGPAVSLHPPEAAMAISSPRRSASAPA